MPEAYAEVSSMRGEQFKFERNDCTVIAFSKVTGMEYAQAHRIFQLFGRKHGRGATTAKLLEFISANANVLAALKINVKDYLFTSVPPEHMPTTLYHLRHSANQYPGRYLVKINRHVFAMIDGRITDDASYMEAVIGMWKFENLGE